MVILIFLLFTDVVSYLIYFFKILFFMLFSYEWSFKVLLIGKYFHFI